MLDLKSKLLMKNDNKIENALCTGLKQPFYNMNSSQRKILFSIHSEQKLQLINAEPPILSTGYENVFGEYASSFVESDREYRVIGRVNKFIYSPDSVYMLLLEDIHSDYYTIIIRRESYNNTESYGYIMDNKILDSLKVGDIIRKNDVILKSISYDQYNNRLDGINLDVAFMADHFSTEDGIIISDVAAARMSSPIVQPVRIIINDNDIPLNLYGDGISSYKSIPDVGEYINDGVLYAQRREKSEEVFFTKSFNSLKSLFISDERFTLEGKITDIDIHCNNPEILSTFYNSQIKYYYDNFIRYANEICMILQPIIDKKNSNVASYDLFDYYNFHKRSIQGNKFTLDNFKAFSNTVIDINVLDIKKLSVGDKITDRYGGKGVISEIRPQYLMPRKPNGKYLDMILNPAGVPSRENPGQLLEVSLTHISDHILNVIKNTRISTDDAIKLYLDFLKVTIPNQYNYMKERLKTMSPIEKEMIFLDSLKDGIGLVIEPVTESIDLDKLADIYGNFPWITPNKLSIPIMMSNGEYRFRDTKRPIVYGTKYIYRLKQYAEDKYSATAATATNIKNQPMKPRANKLYKAPHSKTPVRMGEMEFGSLLHFIDLLPLVKALMIHSASPDARRNTRELLLGDPYNVNIDVDENSVNRNVEILNAKLKAIGLKLVFKKRRRCNIIPVKKIKETTGYNLQGVYRIKEDEYCMPVVKLEENKKYIPAYIIPVRRINLDDFTQS